MRRKTRKKDEKKDEKKEDEEKRKEKEEDKKKEEPDFEELKNPSRVTWAQHRLIGYDAQQRYIPLKQKLFGIVMLKDGRPNEPQQFVVPTAPKIGIPGISDDEPEPPEPFQFLR